MGTHTEREVFDILTDDENYPIVLIKSSHEALNLISQKLNCMSPKNTFKALNTILRIIKDALVNRKILRNFPHYPNKTDLLSKLLQSLESCITDIEDVCDDDKINVLQLLIDFFNLSDISDDLLVYV